MTCRIHQIHQISLVYVLTVVPYIWYVLNNITRCVQVLLGRGAVIFGVIFISLCIVHVVLGMFSFVLLAILARACFESRHTIYLKQNTMYIMFLYTGARSCKVQISLFLFSYIETVKLCVLFMSRKIFKYIILIVVNKNKNKQPSPSLL